MLANTCILPSPAVSNAVLFLFCLECFYLPVVSTNHVPPHAAKPHRGSTLPSGLPSHSHFRRARPNMRIES
ncbi:hypothetical protein DFH11DRAFT_388809 [Phellopilus nigrolimitatus]|nr:hypothetical protein DFH11DRAFT_388809 [Phellopilus nigrolimitatus]